MLQPKWFNSDQDSKVRDVLFLKSDKEFNKHYQYGIITKTKISRDGKFWKIEIEYHNHNENKKRHTRGVLDVIVLHIDELGMMHKLRCHCPPPH